MPNPPCNVTVTVAAGDVDQDGQVTMADAQLVQNYLAGNVKLSPRQLLAADVNGDNQVTIADAMQIGQYAVGAISTFKVCQ